MNHKSTNAAASSVRAGQGSTRLSRDKFGKRYQMQYYDPAFKGAAAKIHRLTEIAWEAYQDGRKSARTRSAGPEFTDPAQELCRGMIL